jgi:hypothetical protein
MAVAGTIKKAKLAAAKERRLERGKKKAEAARKLKAKNV